MTFARAIPLLWLLLTASASAQEAPGLLEQMDAGDCTDTSRLAYASLPRLFFSNEPDTLLSVLMLWDDRCGPAEPITRAIILGAIWDGEFGEDLYDEGIIDPLLWHADEDRRYNRRGMKIADLEAAGGVVEVDLAPGAENFDVFTADLANQLLPHQPIGSLEQFFCLYYAGYRDLAMDMLRDGTLDDTYLQYDYDLALEVANAVETVKELVITNGYWSPRGNLTRVGGKYSLGVQLGQRRAPWFMRGIGELRLGRADYPYWVDKGGVAGYSDRWDAFSIGGEAGRNVLRWGDHHLDLFIGAHYEVVTPFQEEDLNIGGVGVSAGAGYRLAVGRQRRMLVHLDLRHEWTQVDNAGGTNLDGRAWNLRLGLGWVLTKTNAEQRARLAP